MAKLLIVDDNKQNLALMRDFAESWGYTVLTSLHGTEALEITKKEMPDAILLDVMLPGMSGYEVCKELKESEQTAVIPIVMVTALMDMEDRIHGLKLGADYFLSKPLPYNELKVVLENLVNKKNRLDSGEKCFAVIEALDLLAQSCFGQKQFSFKEQMMLYAKKIVKLLHCDEKVERQTTAAIMLYNSGVLADKEKMQLFLQSIAGLKLSSWLRPLAEGIFNFADDLETEETAETKAAVNIMAVLIDYFSTLELIKEEGKTLVLLQNKKIYDGKIIKALNKVVNDKRMFEFLNVDS
ncbi:MAG: response regulator [Acidaminococcaceae bacterium]